mmetsp:Transcript_90232/g.279157  ORF Transcript_90232/g.279157 Transcript_90232/m.279157 type:complete len:243 (+) Transcript_90232:1471-2199(+)
MLELPPDGRVLPLQLKPLRVHLPGLALHALQLRQGGPLRARRCRGRCPPRCAAAAKLADALAPALGLMLQLGQPAGEPLAPALQLLRLCGRAGGRLCAEARRAFPLAEPLLVGRREEIAEALLLGAELGVLPLSGSHLQPQVLNTVSVADARGLNLCLEGTPFLAQVVDPVNPRLNAAIRAPAPRPRALAALPLAAPRSASLGRSHEPLPEQGSRGPLPGRSQLLDGGFAAGPVQPPLLLLV